MPAAPPSVAVQSGRSRSRAEGWLLAQPDERADTARSALAEVASQRVREALAELPTPQQEAITLMDLAGYTAAQTAQIVGAPRGTVLACVHRGRKVLARSRASEREGDGR